MFWVISSFVFFISGANSTPRDLSVRFRNLAEESTRGKDSWKKGFKVLDSLASFEEKAIPYIRSFLDSIEQEDRSYLYVHLNTTLDKNPQFGEILLPSLLDFLERASDKKKKEYIRLLSNIKNKKAINFLKKEIKSRNFIAVNVLFNMETQEAVTEIKEILSDENSKNDWVNFLKVIPYYTRRGTLRETLYPGLLNILCDIESEKEAKCISARFLTQEGKIEGIDWLFRYFSFERHMLEAAPYKRTPFYNYISTDRAFFQYFFPYLGDSDEKFRYSVFYALEKVKLTSFQNFLRNFTNDPNSQIRELASRSYVIYPHEEDSFLFSIPPFFENKISINGKLFRVIKAPSSYQQFYLVGNDSIYEFHSKKIVKRWKVHEYPRLCTAVSNKLIYGTDDLLWVQENGRIKEGFPLRLPSNPIYSISANNDYIFVSSKKEVYIINFTGKIIDSYTMDNLYFPSNLYEKDPVGYSKGKLYFFHYFSNLNKIGIKEFTLEADGNIGDLDYDGNMEVVVLKKNNLEIYSPGKQDFRKILPYNGEEPKEMKFVNLDNDGNKEIIVLTMRNKILIYKPSKDKSNYEELDFPGNAFRIHALWNSGGEAVFVTGTNARNDAIIFDLKTKKSKNIPILPSAILPEYYNRKIKSLFLFTPYMGYLYEINID